MIRLTAGKWIAGSTPTASGTAMMVASGNHCEGLCVRTGRVCITESCQDLLSITDVVS
jgi:hypothetical protein